MTRGSGAGDAPRDLDTDALATVRERHALLRDADDELRRATRLRVRLRGAARQALGASPHPARMVAGLVTGYRTVPRRAAERFDTRALQELIDHGRYDDAVTLAAALLTERRDARAFLSTARKAFGRAGEISWQLAAVRLLQARDDTPELRRQERMLEGRQRETDPGWSPGTTLAAPVGDRPRPPDDRVLHLLKASVPYRQSGYTMRSKYIVDSQRAAGLDPVVMTFPGFPAETDPAGIPSVEEIDGTPYHRLADPAGLADGPPDAYLEEFVATAAPRVREIAPSVLHVHSGHRGYEGALAALALGQACGIPVVYEVRGFFESLWSRELAWNEQGEIYRRRRATETRCMTRAQAVVTLSESMKADIVARGIPAEKVLVVPNGVDATAFRPGARDTKLAARLGLEGAFVAGYVSNLDHFREGHETLIRAVAVLRRRGLAAVALIVGDGDRRDELEAVAADEDAADAVVFTGRVPHDEVLDHYRLLDVFVVPRVDERAARLVTPLKPIEAMAAGVPVVVSDLPALQEIIGDGRRGRSFPPGDAEALADVLGDLAADEPARKQLSEEARAWVVAERRWSAGAERYAGLYRALRTPSG